MKPSWTSGPWVRKGLRILAKDSRETIICVVTGSESNEMAIAEANLIVSAPDLYAALEDCLRRLEKYADDSGITENERRNIPVFKNAISALKSARGGE